jgi:hypothetical protein
MTEISDHARSIIASVGDLNSTDKKAVIEAASNNLPKGDLPRTVLWIILLGGLFVIAGICVVAGAHAGSDQDASPFFLIATAVVSGTLGLFATSPASNK